MCFNNKPLKSGVRVTTGTTTETRQYSGNFGGRKIRGTYEQTLHVPLAQTLDTTGATSASEVFGSKQATDKWFARSPSRPMTEAEYNEFRSSTLRANQGMVNAGAAQVAAFRKGANTRYPVQSPLMIAPRSYDEYMTRANEATSRTRTQVGGGTRATGLNV